MQPIIQLVQNFAVACKEPTFFGLPTWYHYLNLAGKVQNDPITGRCEFVTLHNGFQVNDLALIGLAVVDILLRLSALIAIAYVMYGGFRLITAQGDSGGVKSGQQTIWNALIGLGISLAAIGGVSFLGTVLK
ncbi:MAG TPA: hypothetical protein VLF62_03040 [Candidatus Saccharimonadales bacterium]|nr:hypothetical protein [Candidatus Saccharimonadales bacterium]